MKGTEDDPFQEVLRAGLGRKAAFLRVVAVSSDCRAGAEGCSVQVDTPVVCQSAVGSRQSSVNGG